MMEVIAGNCVLENEDIALRTVWFLKEMASDWGFKLTFKVSWRKDNRSSVDYFQGPSDEVIEKTFKEVRHRKIPLLTDFHHPTDLSNRWVKYVSVLQLPAYLCTQLSMIEALASQRKPINIKKGQFLAPHDMQNIINSFGSYGADNVSITERGCCFGYHDLVLDPRSVYILKQMGKPVYVDAGHLTRRYGIPSDSPGGGMKWFAPTLAKAGIAAGADGIYVEVHPNPEAALCDASTQLSFEEFENLIKDVLDIWQAIHPD